jgi:hypothetical protein
MINGSGWPSKLPESYKNLIPIIRDPRSEKFMNPNECNQSMFLKKYLSDNNFFKVGRYAVTLIKAFKIRQQKDTLKPIKTLIYDDNNDFHKNIKDINAIQNLTQVNLAKVKIL